MEDFLRLAEVASFPLNGCKTIQIGKTIVAVFYLEGEFVAVEEMCPHRGGPLSEGQREGTIVTCPWHRARFDLKSGDALEGPARRGLRHYPTKIEDGWLWVGTKRP